MLGYPVGEAPLAFHEEYDRNSSMTTKHLCPNPGRFTTEEKSVTLN